ncbi:MAG: hypothetical protein ACLFS4_01285 [Opitutales bacterium]
MIECFGQDFAAFGPIDDAPEETLDAFKSELGPKLARRMSPMALLLSGLLHRLPRRPAEAVYFGTTYSDTSSLEKYLDTLPAASPLFFQNSIHPGPLIQAFTAVGEPVPALFPFAGKKTLVFDTLLAALLAREEERLCVFSEARATWMTAEHIAAGETFAFAIRLAASPENALFRLVFNRGKTGGVPGKGRQPEDAFALMESLRRQEPVRLEHPTHGSIEIEWIH